MFASLAIVSLFNKLATWGGIAGMTRDGIAAVLGGISSVGNIMHVVSVWGGIS